MQCSAGHQNQPGATFCSTCGVALSAAAAPPPPQAWNAAPAPPVGYYPPRAANNGMGTAALVVGIISILICGPGGILAIIFGAIGTGRANRGEATNKGAATAGIVLGIIAILIWIILAIVIANSNSNSYYGY